MGKYQSGHAKFLRLRPDQRRVGVIVKHEVQVVRPSPDEVEAHRLVNQHIGALSQNRHLPTHQGVSTDGHDAVRRLDPVAHGRRHRLMTHRTCYHPGFPVRPDFDQAITNLEGPHFVAGMGTPIGVFAPDSQIMFPGVQHPFQKVGRMSRRRQDRKRRRLIKPVHYPAGHHQVVQTADMITVVMRDEHRIKINRRHTQGSQAHGGGPTRVELQCGFIGPNQHPRPRPIRRRNRHPRSRDRHRCRHDLHPTPQSWRDPVPFEKCHRGVLESGGTELWQERSGYGFYAKLDQQLVGSPPEVHQLMAEALYFHFLIVWHGAMGASKKEEQIRQVLRWSNQQVTIPDHFVAALSPGLAHPGQAFFNFRPFQVGYVIEFAKRWKLQGPPDQGQLLKDPWAFKQFLQFEPTSKLFDEVVGDGTYRAQREALLHLVFPDTFEAIVSINHKSLISQAFPDLVTEPTEDVDRTLQQIRRHLELKQRRHFNFYDGDIRAKWVPELRKLWDGYLSQAQACVNTGLLDSWENDYKIEIGRKLAEAREAVLAKADNWVEALAKSLPDNPLGWRSKLNLLNWVDQSRAEALEALQPIWTQDTVSVNERIRTFSDLFSRSEVSGTGVRMRYISVLLMGLDVYLYPPFQTTTFLKAYSRTGYLKPEKDADEAALYQHALGFLDLLMEEASDRGLRLRHRLDAQSLVWMIEDPHTPLNGEPPHLESLATKLHLPPDFLEEIGTLLQEKKQVIFQAPPGTGKTYVAQKLAEHFAGSKERVTLVQFHPSYAYEDFVQGYRPSLLEGQPGFELKDGPLLQAAQHAREDRDADHYLVIDEINRGNLAKVFGELYFLLEYRDEEMRLQYQTDKEFSLPKNLYIIGTMNTADRSIALVDLALRRRFYFVEFHPDDEPIKDLLRNWLQANASDMKWVADVIDLVNKKLEDDRHVAIGPSYFMGTDDKGKAVAKDETSVRRIWKHSVLPYIEEHLFGNLDSMDEWELDKLRKQIKLPTQENGGLEADPDQG